MCIAVNLIGILKEISVTYNRVCEIGILFANSRVNIIPHTVINSERSINIGAVKGKKIFHIAPLIESIVCDDKRQ
jgi:hypothetical protein